MKTSRKAQQLLTRMSAIERMERGKLCRLAGKNHFNLQAWHKGKNEVRYVRKQEREAVQQAIDGYRLFQKLAQDYANEIIRLTRNEHRKEFPTKNNAPKKT